jgi:hypothetical protein
MKGISHFAAGVAVASCFPEAVRQGAAGNPLYFILGGVFGILPDTLDFKFYRFLRKHDMEVIPDPLRPDPKLIAEAVALAVNRARVDGRPVNLKLDTIRLAADQWQSYEVTLDPAKKEVRVRLGPVVDTGGNPVAGKRGGKDKGVSAPLLCDVKVEYTATTKVDILDGPTFRMTPLADRRVLAEFIPWHREWSHSFVTALAPALLCGFLFRDLLAGLIVFGALAAHILADQLGFLGSNLFFPFTRRRKEGLKLVHSDRSAPNLATVWLSCLVIFWNLYRVAPLRPHYNILQFAVFGALLPAAAFLLLRRCLNRLPPRRSETDATTP